MVAPGGSQLDLIEPEEDLSRIWCEGDFPPRVLPNNRVKYSEDHSRRRGQRSLVNIQSNSEYNAGFQETSTSNECTPSVIAKEEVVDVTREQKSEPRDKEELQEVAESIP